MTADCGASCQLVERMCSRSGAGVLPHSRVLPCFLLFPFISLLLFFSVDWFLWKNVSRSFHVLFITAWGVLLHESLSMLLFRLFSLLESPQLASLNGCTSCMRCRLLVQESHKYHFQLSLSFNHGCRSKCRISGSYRFNKIFVLALPHPRPSQSARGEWSPAF